MVLQNLLQPVPSFIEAISSENKNLLVKNWCDKTTEKLLNNEDIVEENNGNEILRYSRSIKLKISF
jgi:hypothetical protein